MFGSAYPNKNRSLVAVPCVDVPGGDPATVNPHGRWCGMEGTIVDMLKHGARTDQLLPAIEMTECCGSTTPSGYHNCSGHEGVMTTAAWTQPSLRSFLKYIAASNISTVPFIRKARSREVIIFLRDAYTTSGIVAIFQTILCDNSQWNSDIINNNKKILSAFLSIIKIASITITPSIKIRLTGNAAVDGAIWTELKYNKNMRAIMVRNPKPL